MFDTVLVPTDHSPYAHAVVHCVQSIPGIRKAILLHVVTTDNVDTREQSSIFDTARKQLEEEAGMIQNGKTIVSSRVESALQADVADTILRIAESERVSLIIIGARGKGIIRSILLGSVSSAVLRRAQTNVLIMRHHVLETLEGLRYEKFCPLVFSKILIPTDFSGPSISSFSFLREFEGIGGIILAHIVSHGETPEIIEAYVEDAEQKLARLREDFVQQGFTVKTLVRVGNPTHEIDRIAEAEDVSLIFMSARGKGRIQQFFLGSTAFSIVEMTKRPVFVVKTP